VGLGIPFIALSLAVDRAPRLIRPLLRHGRAIEVIGGGLVVLMGFALLFDWLRIIAGTFRAWWPQV
jgi:cytochrome c-type biogenesis protein